MPARHAASALLLAALVAPALAPARVGGSQAPVASGLAVSQHAPFVMGDCGVCHRLEAGRPGPLVKAVPALCLECHDEFAGRVPKGMAHARAPVNCTACHAAHNSERAKLLL